MFDQWESLDDAELLRSMAASLRAERAAAAARIVAAGVFAARREAGPGAETATWCVEDFDVAEAEVSAELGISRHRAGTAMSLGSYLIRRLPKVTARFLAGDVDLPVAAMIEQRSLLVQDCDVLTRLDAELASAAPHWNALSRKKLTEVVDWLVVSLDPDARRQARERRDDRHIDVNPGQHGMSEIVGHLPAAEAAILDARLNAVAATVCHHDTRTKNQRRADAMIALAEGSTALGCRCGLQSCTATAQPEPGASSQIVIHVLAERSTLDGTSDKPAYLPGQGPIPAGTVQDLATSNKAKIRPVAPPEDLTAEPGYRPSRKLADFLLSRDLTCRFPSCDRAAERCDYDHTVRWPYGSTHPSDLKAYCRFHHLMKTFWGGPRGWNDTQHPDGTITFTSPSGRTYSTSPLGAWFFPQLATPTGIAPASTPPHPSGTRTLKMPRRRRTRTAERHARITAERDANPPPF